MKTVFPVGTTLYEPDECANGYTLVSGSGVVRLVTMNGEPAHEWRVGGDGPMGYIHRARLLSNGNLMILVGPAKERPGHLEEYDWDGRLTWEYTPDAGDPHHDFWPREDGGVLLICKEPVPPEVTGRITDEPRKGLTIYGDVLIEVSRDKKVIWLWHQHDHLDINTCNPIPAGREWRAGPDNNTITDWTHTNTIQALP
ncbi:MAG: aryl-sulfate sulfotransferase, partial [Planctomycetota bacterium]